MDMVKETEYCKKVQQVLEFLQSPNCHVHDDTLYHKLLDSLSIKVISPEFAEKCGVVDFLQRVGNNSDVSSDTLVFAVQLVEKLVSSLEIPEAHVSVMALLIETVTMKTPDDNLSVLCALFKTMSTVIHYQCVKKFCSYLNFNEVLKKSVDNLKEERSIFLSRAVSDFVYLLFTSEISEFEGVKNLLKELKNIIVNLAIQDNCRVSSPASCSLRVLEKVPHLFDDCFEEILDVLVKLLEKGNTLSAMTATKCLSSLSQCQDETKVGRVKSLVSKVLQSVDIVRSLHIAKILYPLQLLDEKVLEDHILKPLRGSDGSCYSVAAVSQSLNIVTECNIQNPNVCQCVLNLLHLTGSRQDNNRGRNVFTGNSRLQLKSLEYLRSYVCKEMVLSATSSISSIVSITTDHMIYKKCLDCICGLLPDVLCSLSSATSTLDSDLRRIRDSVQRNFCRVEWEFRDTSCEFVTNLLNKHKGNDAVMKWMQDCRYPVFAYQALSDGESYVRATSLGTLQAVLQSPYHEHLLQSTNTSIDEVISQVLDICTTDSEAFPRRSAARLVHHCWRDLVSKLQPISLQSIVRCFSVSLPSDFDWEVKLIAVDFWCVFLKQSLTGDLDTEHTVVSTECLKAQKERKSVLISVSTAVDVLLKLSGDYDPSVNERVFQELCWISEALHGLNVNQTSSGTDDHCLCSCSPCVQTITELSDIVTENRDKVAANGSRFKTDYDSNAISLLDDILSLDHSPEGKEEDNAIDCY